jgi:group I intron endonuclease
MFKHKVSGKVYVGQAVNLYKRYSRHRNSVRHLDTRNRPLVKAFQKYGFDAFEWFVLELCPADAAVLTAREQFWMDHWRSTESGFGYNAAPAAGTCAGIKHSAETRAKVAAAGMGRKHAPETIERMRAIKLGKKKTPEEIEKNRLAHLGKKNPVKRGRGVAQIDMRTGAVLATFISASAAGRVIGCHPSAIRDVANGGIRKSAKGYGWAHVENN